MQTKFGDGSAMVCGGCSKDADVQLVGEKNSRKCSVGLAVGKNEDGTTKWANVVAWHSLASVLGAARKGDPVLVIGRLESREYNGKTYTDLVAEYVSVCASSAASSSSAAPLEQAYTPAMDDDGELPF